MDTYMIQRTHMDMGYEYGQEIHMKYKRKIKPYQLLEQIQSRKYKNGKTIQIQWEIMGKLNNRYSKCLKTNCLIVL